MAPVDRPVGSGAASAAMTASCHIALFDNWID